MRHGSGDPAVTLSGPRRVRRRDALAVLAGLGLCLGTGPRRALAQTADRVLFVGNSFTMMHGVPAQVAALAAADGRTLMVRQITAGGSSLARHLSRDQLAPVLAEGWDALVLQDVSLFALHRGAREASLASVVRIMELAGDPPTVLFVPWPLGATHSVYSREMPGNPGWPRTPAEMAALNEAQARRMADATGARVASVAGAWAEAMAAGQRLHARDDHHANPEGAALAARVIWQALAPLLR